MGLRGPKADSPEVRKRKGFPGGRGKTPTKAKISAAALTKLPYAPKRLSAEAIEEWKRVGKVLVKSGKLTQENLRLFEGYCYSFGVFQDAQEKLQKEDLVVFGGRLQEGKPNVLIAIAKDAQNMMLKMLRAIQTSTTLAPDSKQDPLEQFFKRAEKLKVVKK